MDKALFAGLAITAIVALLVRVDAVGHICMIIFAMAKVLDILDRCEQLVKLAMVVHKIIDSLHSLFLFIQPPAHWNLQPGGDHAETFTVAQIRDFTNNFADVIDQGDSGMVYMGKLHNGRRVAVKRLEDGPLRRAEDTFVRELAILYTLRHEHIVRLVGWCAEAEERMLVYEYMDDGTLRYQLNDTSPVTAPSWRRRVEVLLGAARAIEHLHCHAVPLITHGNVTSSNILLDRSLKPRVSGFGSSVSRAPGVVVSQPVDVFQTNGYADPGYRRTGLLKPASDVYRLGVVMLEALTGKQPVGRNSGATLVSWVLPSIEAGNLGYVLDSVLASEPTPRQREALQRVADTAASCLCMDGDHRLAISHVVANLEEALDLICKDDLRVRGV